MDTLSKNIQELGFITHIINKPHWKFLDYKDSLKPNSVFIFDTSVGCGEFAERYPQEVSKDKWKNAFGLMRCHSTSENKFGISFSVIPKHVVDDKETVSLFLNVVSTCTSCGKVTPHVTIYHETKEVYCMECDYEIKQFIKNMNIYDITFKN
jgi:hypothetical protein